MRWSCLCCLLLSACARPEPSPPTKEPVSPQLLARTGFLLQQIDKKDAELRACGDDVNELSERIQEGQRDQATLASDLANA